MKYRLRDFDFNLPDDLIATKPAEPRDSSRLLVLDKKTGKIEHKHFYDIIDYLHAGDVLVLNNSKVIPARLWAKKKETGGKVEVLLHKKLSANTWQCLLGGKVKEGLVLSFRPSAPRASGEIAFDEQERDPSAGLGMTKKGELSAKILKNNHDGTWDLKFNKSGVALMKMIEKIGEVPLPPYILKQIKNKKEKRKNNFDKSRYQTIYADDKKTGSVAAPTAGLHFTPELLKKIKKKGVKILEITLYVGMGTFAPVKTENILEHKMHAEWVEINRRAINQLRIKKEELRNKKNKGRIIAVGTTSCRSLEACWKNLPSAGKDFKSWVDIFIYPGYKFKIVDAMITNFHLPKSTLLMLVSALAGKKNIDRAYTEAIKKKYQFYSYGDAMLIK
ncbi:MAG: tRNA preQ1(34) S-adenosylmethionine ribosyltransferase-isomerase QueA [Patescibacteria group bacterium]|nr:tRNA preQ1(34) S-adenosylmethionine ribosyltransferase-isomerase QueA [Patescibacteria group bacterium]